MSLVERLSRTTPNDLFKTRPFRDVLLEKPSCPQERISAIQGLPLKISSRPRVLGIGDWGYTRSSEGTVVIDGGDFVAKIPLGTDSRDALEEARRQMSTIERFKEVSPPTAVVVTKVEPGLPPKPVIIQEKVVGLPACETPLRDLLKIETLKDIKRILNVAHSFCFETGMYDLYGQHFTEGCLFLFYLLPFFSDNIMVKNGGGACLTDNVPGASRRFLQEGEERKMSIKIKFASVRLLIDFLIILRKT